MSPVRFPRNGSGGKTKFFSGTGPTNVGTREVPTPDPVVGAFVDTVTRGGITLGFDKEYEVGAYVNGDPWILIPAGGQIDIINSSPQSVTSEQKVINGGVFNPKPNDSKSAMGWSAFSGAQSSYSGVFTYVESANKLRQDGAVPDTFEPIDSDDPLVITVEGCLVCIVNKPFQAAHSVVQSMAPFTFTFTRPKIGDFRPGYCLVGARTSPFNISDIDESLIDLKLQLPNSFFEVYNGADAPGDVYNQHFSGMWFDAMKGSTARVWHPQRNGQGIHQQGYGGEGGKDVSTATMTLLGDFPIEQKRDLLYAMIQLGIDRFAILGVPGGDASWGDSGGGHFPGIAWPIMFAGKLLGDDDMQNIVTDFQPNESDIAPNLNGQAMLGNEWQQIFYTQDTSPPGPAGEMNNGHGGYLQSQEGMPDWGQRHAVGIIGDWQDDWFWRVSDVDDPKWSHVRYRHTWGVTPIYGWAMGALALGMESKINHSALFDYLDRHILREIQESSPSWTNLSFSVWGSWGVDFYRIHAGTYRPEWVDPNPGLDWTAKNIIINAVNSHPPFS